MDRDQGGFTPATRPQSDKSWKGSEEYSVILTSQKFAFQSQRNGSNGMTFRVIHRHWPDPNGREETAGIHGMDEGDRNQKNDYVRISCSEI